MIFQEAKLVYDKMIHECCHCGRTCQVHSMETRLDGCHTIKFAFCKDCRPLVGNDTPILRTCSYCGIVRNIRRYNGCSNSRCCGESCGWAPTGFEPPPSQCRRAAIEDISAGKYHPCFLGYRFFWLNKEVFDYKGDEQTKAALPGEVFEKLKGGKGYWSNASFAQYGSTEEALADLAEVLAVMKRSDLEESWTPSLPQERPTPVSTDGEGKIKFREFL